MKKRKTTRRRLRSLFNGIEYLLGQPTMDPLFSLRLASIKFKIEPVTKALDVALETAQKNALLKDSAGDRVEAKDPKTGRKLPGNYQLDPKKAEAYKELVEKILDQIVGFKSPDVKFSSLIEAWEVSANEDEDDPEKVKIPGWITGAFFEAGILVLDVDAGDVDFLKDLEDDEEDEELDGDAVADGPQLPDVKPEKPAKKDRKKTARS